MKVKNTLQKSMEKQKNNNKAISVYLKVTTNYNSNNFMKLSNLFIAFNIRLQFVSYLI